MTEEEDFMERHIDAIAEAMKPPYPVTVVHGTYCTRGKRQWMLTRHWPFVHTWISTAVCTCGINEILNGSARVQQSIADIVAILDMLK